MSLQPLARRWARSAALLLSVCFTVTAWAQPPKQYSIRDFFSNPTQTTHRISPDGQWLAFLRPYEQRMNLYVQRLDARAVPQGEAQRLTSITDRDIASYAWASNDRLVYRRDFGGDENFHVFSVGVDGAPALDLTPFEKVRADIVDTLRDSSELVLIEHNQRDPESNDVYRVNILTGKATRIAENPGNIVGWMTDHAGQLRVAVTSEGANTSLLFRQREDQPFRKVVTTNFKEALEPLGFTANNRLLYVSSNRGRNTRAIRLFDPLAGKEGTVLHQNDRYDVTELEYSERRRKPESFGTITTKRERYFVDGVAQRRYATLATKLPGMQIDLLSRSDDETKWTLRASNDRTRGSEYLFDNASGTLTKLVDLNPALAMADMAAVQPIAYPARDRFNIEGYLTLPVGVEPRGLPVVVMPHGGPWARDVWGYDPRVQLLANRGYAVLQMNFRGSTGYGRKFFEASHKQWGGSMQDDITDGVQWLIARGIADPKRVAIFGGSYGGYAVLSGITKTPDLYAAAIDYCGVSNLFTLLANMPPYWEPLREQMYEMVGHPERDKALLERVSPLLQAEKIKTPLLVAQGANDPRVKQQESDQIVAALRNRGVAVEYLLKQNEGHGFRNEENRFELYAAMEKFLAEHVPVERASL